MMSSAPWRLPSLTAFVMLLVSAAPRPPPSLGPGRGSWIVEQPEAFGIDRSEMDLVAERTRVSIRERYCLLFAVDGHLIGEYVFANSTETSYESDSLGKQGASSRGP